MTEYLNIIIQLILIAVLSVISLYLVKLSKTLNKEKRLNKFTVPAITEKTESFFDKFENFYASLVKILSKFNSKIGFLVKYSEKYEIYVDQTEKIRKNSMDFISHKILIAIITTLITIISDVLRMQYITVIQILFSLIIGFFIPDIFLYFSNKRKAKIIENDFLKAITIMNNAFKTGRSVMQAIQLVYLELDGPISDEFKKMYIDLTYGLELEKVFDRFAKRVKLEEVNYMASSLVILNKTGGNVVKVFDSIERGFFERKKLKEELKSATALSELVFKTLILMPILIFVVVYIFNNQYFTPLFTTIIGRVILIIIFVIYISYILIVRNLTKLKE